MHNKRLGRDDILKIEVRKTPTRKIFLSSPERSGLVPLHLLRGALSPDATAIVVLPVLLAVADLPHLAAAVAAITLPERMIAVIVIAMETVTAAATVTVRAALTPGKFENRFLSGLS